MKIAIATDFSPYPAGRFRSDGPFSGEKFREEFLLPALQSSEPVTVTLAGTKGYGSSFLEEAFGGLVRYGYFTSDAILSKLTIDPGEPAYHVYAQRALDYIKRASFNVDKKSA